MAWGWRIYNIVESESDPLTRWPIDLFEKEPLKGKWEVNLHTPTKFGEDPSKDLGGNREHTNKRCSNYSMITIQHLLKGFCGFFFVLFHQVPITAGTTAVLWNAEFASHFYTWLQWEVNPRPLDLESVTQVCHQLTTGLLIGTYSNSRHNLTAILVIMVYKEAIFALPI